VGVVAVLSLCASGCATHDALSLAQKACAHVDRAVALYARSQAEGSAAQAQTDASASQDQLRAALPIAAVAAGESPQWQALMTTLTEAGPGRVPEQYLFHALTAQCADAQNNGVPAP